jgi:hypothetical protein
MLLKLTSFLLEHPVEPARTRAARASRATILMGSKPRWGIETSS